MGSSASTLESIWPGSNQMLFLGVLKKKLDMGDSEIESDDLSALVTFRCTFLLFFYAILTSWNTYGYRYRGDPDCTKITNFQFITN